MSWIPSPRPESHAGASAEARRLLTEAKKLCGAAPDLDTQDERVRVAIASLTRALESA
jgi:hypothetical protein